MLAGPGSISTVMVLVLGLEPQGHNLLGYRLYLGDLLCHSGRCRSGPVVSGGNGYSRHDTNDGPTTDCDCRTVRPEWFEGYWRGAIRHDAIRHDAFHGRQNQSLAACG
jgi:hypothetical protein